MKKIILWLPQGRLGNLIFQYQALLQLKSESVSLWAIESQFTKTFEVDIAISYMRLPPIFKGTITNIVNLAAKYCIDKKIISTVEICYENKEINLKWNYGFFKKIIIFIGFYQNSIHLLNSPKIRKKYLIVAKNKLLKCGELIKVAVHFRFGDYQNWTILGKSGLVLPDIYYRDAISKINQIFKFNVIYIIFTDDVSLVDETIFGSNKFFYFSGNDYCTDFAAITLCDHAIISASTFAWWGGQLINNKNKIIVAPKYWLGFKSNIWHPSEIINKQFTYIDVAV